MINHLKKPPNVILPLSLVLFVGVIFHGLTFDFPLTKKVSVLKNRVIPSLLDINKPSLGIVFAVVVNSLTVDELKKLFGQLRTSHLLILLIAKPWFGGQKRNSENYLLKITLSIFSSVTGKFVVWISIFNS